MKVAVIGASDNPQRYSNLAARALMSRGHEVFLYGLRDGEIESIQIKTDLTPVEGIDTVTIYVNPQHLSHWQPLIKQLKPQRIIFNPGTENFDIMGKYQNEGLQVIQGCTLVMLSANTF